MKEDDLNVAFAGNVASLKEIDEALAESPMDDDLIQVRGDLQAAGEGLLAALAAQQEDASVPTAEITPRALHSVPSGTAGPPADSLIGSEPDFLALAERYPDLGPHVRLGQQGRGVIDFKSFEAARQLTRALLADDYGVNWWVPDGHLIPPVTNRANYIHWLHSLLELCPAQKPVRVLDIGCGANLIYPLLGAAMHGWHFVGVDITNTAIEWAHKNAAANPQLAHLLELRRGPSQGHEAGVLSPAIQEGEGFTFTMCNPPFFESMEEAGQNPATAFSGTAAEMVCPGGELAFVMRMVTDSLQLKERVAWFTTMVGKKETLKRVRAMLHALGVPSVRSMQFTQGRTHRWGLAWSFKAPQQIARKQSGQVLAVSRSKHTFSLMYPKGNPSKLLRLLASTVEAHGGTVDQDPEKFMLSASFQEESASGDSAISAGLPRGMPHAEASDNVKGEGTSLSVPQEASATTLSVSEDANERAVKRQRTHGAHSADVGRRQCSFRMMMTLRQESAGAFVVIAALQQAQLADTTAVATFTAKCHAIHQDIDQLLHSVA